MPHLRFRGMEKKEIKKISKNLVEGLSEIIGCPADWFTLEYINSEFIFDGEDSSGYPFVEVFWFDRGQEAKNKAAYLITEAVRENHTETDICVIFTNLNEKDYYENGKHF